MVYNRTSLIRHGVVLRRPNSSIDELEEAALAFCEMPWNEVARLHEINTHPQTREEKLPARWAGGAWGVLCRSSSPEGDEI